MIIRLLVTAAAVLVAAGCGSGEQPPEPTVPAVETPKGLVGIDPCVLLDDTARGTLGLAAGVPGTDELGANCSWRGENAVSAQLTAFTSGKGLSDLTRDRDSSTSRVRLLGYPALETFTSRGEFCRYDVGVAQDQAIVATMRAGEPDSCSALQELLTVVIERLPATG
ncbi:DUF3558 domain-containing protein [Actinophytocola oryzae]|uniref:Uncharacterized protein DUF3558 n=1 Tax=Actinophytocola oryzae TaxID=502181 RepID=A0A4R7VEY7_9PSEU|nr:DUF3558 domain-containing protein [Actinophytocola oryzae]TDV47790.1 uncharacterized protein DUF3558 [Actinophytocola oryzae]